MSTSLAVDYIDQSQRYRPTNPCALAAEIKRLVIEQHLTANDVAIALRVDIGVVREVLQCRAVSI